MPILHALVYKCKLWIYVYIVYICTLCKSGCDPHFKEAWRKKQEEQKLMDFNNNIESDPLADMPQSCTFWWNLHRRKYMLKEKKNAEGIGKFDVDQLLLHLQDPLGAIAN